MHYGYLSMRRKRVTRKKFVFKKKAKNVLNLDARSTQRRFHDAHYKQIAKS